MLRRWLREELERRRARNRRYSLRAFARDLAIDHTRLSRILRGQRITKAALARLAVPREVAVATLRGDAETAVVDAVARDGFRPDSRWIATRTGVSVDDVNAALHRLLRAGRLAMVSANRWVVT